MPIRCSNPNVFLRLTIITMCCLSLAACFQRECFNLQHELAYCSRKHHVRIPENPRTGYNFGYGTLNDTEYMCRTRWHILVMQCMRKRSEESCKNSEEEKFKHLIWSLSMETKRLERAAAYMCHEHNLRILRDHRHKCLLQQEKSSEQCTIPRNDTIREVVTALQNLSAAMSSSASEYYRLIKLTLAQYECRTIRAKLECLYTLLHQTCPPDPIRLIMNYFKETLPDGCTFHYENRLTSQPPSANEIVNPVQQDPGATEIRSFPLQGTRVVSGSVKQKTKGSAQAVNFRNAPVIACPLLTLNFLILTSWLFR